MEPRVEQGRLGSGEVIVLQGTKYTGYTTYHHSSFIPPNRPGEKFWLSPAQLAAYWSREYVDTTAVLVEQYQSPSVFHNLFMQIIPRSQPNSPSHTKYNGVC